MKRRAALGGFVLVLASMALALARCDQASSDDGETIAARPEASLAREVALVGCAFAKRRQCEVTRDTKSLTLFVESPAENSLEAFLDDHPIAVERQVLAEGSRLALSLGPQRTGLLRLVISRGEQQSTWSHELRLVTPPEPWRRAIAARRAGDLDGASAALDELSKIDATWAARGDSLRARIALMRGQQNEAIATLDKTMAAHRSAGRVSDEASDALVLVYLLRQEGRLAEASLVLTAAKDALAAWGEGPAQGAYYRALLEQSTGNLGAAMRGLEVAARQAEQRGLGKLRDDARTVLATILTHLGRHRAARALLEGLLLGATEPDCRRATLLDNLAWQALMQAEGRSQALPPETVAQLDEALAIFEGPCPQSNGLRSTRLTRAHAALHLGDLESVETLARLVAADVRLSRDDASALAIVKGQAALMQDEPHRALALLPAAEAAARRGLHDDVAWRLAMIRGEALAAVGNDEAALAAWRGAEELLDRASLAIPLGEGRASFLGGREASAVAVVAQLVSLNRFDQALHAARRARARAMASAQRMGRIEGLAAEARAELDQRMERYQRARGELGEALGRRWEVTGDALPEHDAKIERLRAATRRAVADAYALLDEPSWSDGQPRAAGELLLAFFPRPGGSDRWWCFAQDDTGSRALAIDLPTEPDAQTLRRILLEPLEASVARATSLRVLAYGPWQDVDVHALPWQSGPLLASLPVSYGVDVRVSPRAGAGRRAVVVADAGGDLPHARAEGAAVERALASAGVRRLDDTSATRDALAGELARAALFHYAGHGRLHEHRLASHLELAEGDAFTVGDVLALPRVPAQIVLSGCATARTDDEAPVADLSLAAAFLLAGAEAVIATSRPVRDQVGSELATRIYAGFGRPDWKLGEALRRAQLDLASGGGSEDWSAYRVITR